VATVRAQWRELPANQRWLLVAAMALGAAVVVAYVLATRPNGLAGDQAEYDLQGRFFDQGKFWWSTAVLGSPHATAWKAPLYPAWVGLWYSLLGPGPTKVEIVQALVAAPLTVLLTWVGARRWFDWRVATVSAFVVALFPLTWEFFGLLYSEALAIPLTLLVLVLVIGRPAPTAGRALGIGAIVGVCLLIRPTSFFLLAVLAASWIVAAGWRSAVKLTAVATVAAVLVVAPWTIRNAIVLDAFIPISIQDAAAYGTFNDEAANDHTYPYAWRAAPGDLAAELRADPPASEAEFRSRLQTRARDYVKDHPTSVLKAFFWNGISRYWDVRRPGRALDETSFDGRSRTLTAIGLGAYYVLLPLAIVGLWRARRRRELFVPFLVLAVSLSVVFTIQAGTRYRAPVEPVLVVLACSNLTALRRYRSVSAAYASPT
jgi:4-amino-4-deoxy-L-arabinose transferase-like glycosyltransferase